MAYKKPPNKAFQELVKAMRSYGINKYGQRAKLAQYLGVHRAQIGRWLSLSHEPTYSQGKMIEKYLAKPFQEITPAYDLAKRNIIGQFK